MTRKPLKVIAGTPDHPLVIDDISIPCYVLEDETRVLSQSGMFTGLGLARRGLVSTEGGAQLPRFAASKSLNPFISNELRHGLTNPILFRVNGAEAYGFPATILADICEAVLAARNSGSLNQQQYKLAEQCETLMRGFARVGIIGLVDEANGYQRIRTERALATILEKFIAKELRRWTRTFPYEFYEQIFRLKRWNGPNGQRRPSVIGHYTNDIVYSRLAPGLLDELKRKNPKLPSGRRRNTHQQWFTPDFGHPKLKEHLAAVIALMKVSSNWNAFQRNLDRVFPKIGETIELNLDD